MSKFEYRQVTMPPIVAEYTDGVCRYVYHASTEGQFTAEACKDLVNTKTPEKPISDYTARVIEKVRRLKAAFLGKE